jgi:putative intracellular protease/amidase
LDINIILFDNFEILDSFGPVEVFGRLPECYKLKYYSVNGGIMTSKQGVRILTEPMKEADGSGILLIPGGQGTRKLVNDEVFIRQIKEMAEKSCYCLTVCTGSALLAKTGLLKIKRPPQIRCPFNG